MALNPTAPDPSQSSPPVAGSPAGPDAVAASDGGSAAAATPPAEETQTLDQFEAATSTRTDEAGRDEKGRFVRPRHRARSQEAHPADVPRIAELTRRLKDAEAERDRLKGGVASPPPVASVPTPLAEPSRPAGSAPPTAAPSPYPPVAAAADDPEPDAEKYTDLTKWMRDHARWSAREELRVARADYDQKQAQAQQQAEGQRLSAQWRERVTAAKAKYADFEQVALLAPTSIPQGSMLDAWIIEHKAGADVLYHFQKSPTELQQLLAMPVLEQVEALSLLSQRLTGSPTRTAAGTTGAVPAQPAVQPVARPPTPVRTGPMRTGEEPPADLDTLSLSAFAKATNGGRRQRA